jgi:signal transduction histidine kinase
MENQDSCNCDKDKLLQRTILDKAVVEGKFEIASNVLHDIGNAVVGFSSYLNRIKQSLELDNSENLQQLAGFFETQQPALSGALGEAKADAVVKVLSGIVHTQKSNQADIGKSIGEQEKIILHIRQMLNIQRQYINGDDIIERKPLHIEGLLDDCISMIFASVTKRGITISRDAPGSLPLVKGDHTRLMQVILNILKNSIEAIDLYAVDKSIAITITHDDRTLSLQIRDTGKGFDEVTGSKLFNRGFTTKSSGSGLGLQSCRMIVEDHNGTIDISSDGPGKGAVTTIKFHILPK